MRKKHKKTIMKYMLLLILPYLLLAVGDSFLHDCQFNDTCTGNINSSTRIHTNSTQNINSQTDICFLPAFQVVESHHKACAACTWAKCSMTRERTFNIHSVAIIVASSPDTATQSYHHDFTANTPSRAPPVI